MVVIPTTLYLFRVNKITLFWTTYILTRPFGASGADWLGKPIKAGGIGLGDGTTASTLVFMIICIVYLSIKHKKNAV